jgi:hypothetical protein
VSSTRNWPFQWHMPPINMPQVPTSGTQGNVSHPLAVVVVLGCVWSGTSAPWRLAFETPISRVSLNVGGVGLDVGAVPPHTCRACDLAAVVLPPPNGPAVRLGFRKRTDIV